MKPKVFTCERKEGKKIMMVTSFPGIGTALNNLFVRNEQADVKAMG